MAARLTPTAQRGAVSEGMAIALVALGVRTLPYRKTLLGAAFTGAWRGWEYRSTFPQVTTDIEKMHAESSLVWSRPGRQTTFQWETGRDLDIRGPIGDGLYDAAELDDYWGMLAGGVPGAGWLALARDFLDRFGFPPDKTTTPG